MPNRILREGIITSEPVNKLTWAEEVFYRRLHSVADDYGRFSAHPSLLRAACYPLRLNDVSDRDVGKWLESCSAKGLITVYEVDAKPYLEITKFDQRVRADKSKFPANDGQVTVTRQSAAPVVEGVVVVEGDKDSRAPRSVSAKGRKTQLPEGFGTSWSESMQAWLGENCKTGLQAHLTYFVGYVRANGKTYANWEQAFQNAVRDDWAKVGSVGKNGHPQWWASDASIEAKARELGMWPPRPGENWQQLKGRINERLGAQ